MFMNVLKPLSIATAAAITVGCGGGGGSSSNDVDVNLTGYAAMPNQMAIVPPTDQQANSLMRSINARAVHNTASYAASSDYIGANQNTYVWLDAIEPIEFVDNFLCFTGQTRPLEMLGEGDYVAWADASRCFDEEDGSSQQEGGNNQQTNYVTIVANSSQEDSDEPLSLRGWIEDYAGQSGSDGGPAGIKLMGTVYQTPTDANPFGVFSLTYGLLPSLSASESDSTGYGEVTSSETTDGGSSFTLYQRDEWDNMECEVTASVDYNDATSEGLARTSRSCIDTNTNQPAPYGNAAYALAANAQYVHVAEADDYAGLSNPSSEMCLMRDEVTQVVWSYQLFNKSDGSAVEINSGMQLKVDSDGDGSGSDGNGFESWGHIGYWGSWREDGTAFADGETVQQATWDDSVGQNYTVKVAPGRLVKNSVEAVDLSDLQGVTFNTWMNENDSYMLSSATDFNGNSNTTDGLDLVVQPNSSNDGFEVVGIQNGWDENGPDITTVDPAVAIPLNANVSLHLWSNQLGGSVKYTSGSSKLRLFARSYVNGSETGAGELFAGGDDVDLLCLERCLKNDVSAADASNWEDVFETDSSTARQYDFSRSDLTLVNDGGSNAIGFTSNVSQSDIENSNWSWGLETGPMVLSGAATDAADFYTKLEAGTITEFYVWETGLNEWQQQVVLVDGSNNVVEFDQPLSFKYTHEQANDRDGSATNAGQIYFLEYGGKGQLWGLPYSASGDGEHWYPELSLNDGTIVGASDQYVVKALDIEQKMASTSLSNCSNLPLTAPSQSVPTEIAQNVFGIGSMPDVGDQPPSVIDGELVE